MIIIYIYIPPSPEVCKISDPDEENALAPWGAKKNDQGLKSILDQNSMPFIVEVSLSRGNMGQAAKQQKWTTSFHMNFFTWDTPQVNKFIWISLLRTPQRWATSYEFLLYLGHLTSQQIHEFLDLGHAKSEPLQCEFDHMFIGKLKI